MIYWWFFIEIEFNSINKYSFTVIDIRDSNSYLIGHLDNSLNIPFNQLIINPQKYLNKENNYLLVCEYGFKSKKTAEILKRQGYKTFSLKNGIKNFF